MSRRGGGGMGRFGIDYVIILTPTPLSTVRFEEEGCDFFLIEAKKILPLLTFYSSLKVCQQKINIEDFYGV